MKNDKNHCLYVKRPNIMILFMDLFLGLIEVICLNIIILGDNKQKSAVKILSIAIGVRFFY